MVVGDEYLSPVLPSSVLCLRRAAPQRPSEYAGQTVAAQQNSSSASSTHVQHPPQARAEVSEYASALLNINMTTVALPCTKGLKISTTRLHWAENERVRRLCIFLLPG